MEQEQEHIWDLGLGARGSGLMTQGLGFGTRSSGLDTVLNTESLTPDSRIMEHEHIRDSGLRAQDTLTPDTVAELWVANPQTPKFGTWYLGFQVSAFRTKYPIPSHESRTLKPGESTMSGFRVLSNSQILSAEFRVLGLSTMALRTPICQVPSSNYHAMDAMAAGLAMALRIFLQEGPFNDADTSGSDTFFGIVRQLPSVLQLG
ncbi:uncharacterized protein HD556DRAFT_1308740 [Suillus plorans]|uniref:Uncharacterized protein n=1 Tax=Suillus plorans TaxID=116603 RepID=A0A9P7AQ54_9AGAM|nr:uncharacterized protein HD556DRAFT_1308740 [Suillus plorans]KAG1793312.1 hypothetical protein HD556DRAFT_1308740 [Suillus plorans]